MGIAIFQGLPAPGPLNRFSKNFAQLITSVTPPHMQKFGSVGPKGVCLRMREFVIVRRLFLFFFSFMLMVTGLPVGPLIAVNGLNGVFWWHECHLLGASGTAIFSIPAESVCLNFRCHGNQGRSL